MRVTSRVLGAVHRHTIRLRGPWMLPPALDARFGETVRVPDVFTESHLEHLDPVASFVLSSAGYSFRRGAA